MASIKLSITCRTRLQAKYEAQAIAAIDAAIARWIAADKSRGITTIHIAVDDAKAMKKYKVSAVSGTVTAAKVKKALDALIAKLDPDYIVLLGAGDVVPLFSVPNPTAPEDGEAKVETDNPYASSQKFNSGKRSSYLVPDRVVGRIPDLPNGSDPSWLLDYLLVATRWEGTSSERYANDLLVCCDTWKGAGRQCVQFIARQADRMIVSPPTGDRSANLRSRHSALLHMIKCHGAQGDSQFYGQKGSRYPAVLRSTSILKRTKAGTIAAAMCCFGANVFDPLDQANVNPGEPPIPSVYLRQGAFGFFGSTTTAWVGADTMMCADWVVASFLRAILGGASLGRAALETKQDFLRWIQQQGNHADAGDQKTMLQFALLGDPSIHPVKAASAGEIVSASLLGTSTRPAVALARRQRRAARRDLGAVLRGAIPRVTALRAARVPAAIRALAHNLARRSPRLLVRLAAPRVERVSSTVTAATAPNGRVTAAKPVERVNLHYYWATTVKDGPVRNIRLVSIQADPEGTVLRSQVVVSS